MHSLIILFSLIPLTVFAEDISQITTRSSPPPLEARGDEPYTYDPTGKPDPFKPFLSPVGKPLQLTPLQRLKVTQLTLVGIIWNAKISKAMVQDPSGKGYILSKGTLVGAKGGYVKEILKNKVIIEEKTKDFMGRVKVKKVELVLKKSGAGERL